MSKTHNHAAQTPTKGVPSSSSSSSSSSLPTKCTYCQYSLGAVSIKCGECVNFYLCLRCFSMSAEIGPHKKDHNYHLKSSISFPIFNNEVLWTYKEELLLLQYIEQFGFGNWEEIAKQLPNRTSDECMQHYHSYYIYGNLGKNTFNSTLKKMLKLTDDDDDQSTSPKYKSSLVKSEPHQNGHQNSDSDDDDADAENNDEDEDEDDDDDDTKFKLATPPFKNDIDDDVKRNKRGENNISLSSSDEMATTVLLPPLEMSIDEQRVLGYMPLRDDFDREYKNDAETLLSNLSIANQQLIFLNNTNILNNLNGDETDAIDFYLKLTLIKMYRECLCERGRFKKIARDYGLINNATALINSHARVMSNHTMYYNSSLVYFNHKTANSYYNSFNFILNNPSSSGLNSTNNNSLMSTVMSSNQHNSNGTNGQHTTNGNCLDESNVANSNNHANTNTTTSNNNTFNINSLLANGDLLDGKRRGKRSENDKEMIELNDKLKKYAQFLQVSDYEHLLENLRKQRKLAKRIQELQYYRTQLGLTKLAHIESYKREREELKYKRQCKRKEKKDLFVQMSTQRQFQTRNSSLYNKLSTNAMFSTPQPQSKSQTKLKFKQQQQLNHTIQNVTTSTTTTSLRRFTRNSTSSNLNDSLLSQTPQQQQHQKRRRQSVSYSPAKRLHLDHVQNENNGDENTTVNTTTDLNNVSNVRNFSSNNSRASSRSNSATSDHNNNNNHNHHQNGHVNINTNGNGIKRNKEKILSQNNHDNVEENEEQENENLECANSEMLTDDLDEETEEDESEEEDEDEENESDNNADEEEDADEGVRMLRRSNSNIIKKTSTTTILKTNGNGNDNGHFHASSKKKKNNILAASNNNNNNSKSNEIDGTRNRLCSLPGYNLLSDNEKKVNKKYFSIFNFKATTPTSTKATLATPKNKTKLVSNKRKTSQQIITKLKRQQQKKKQHQKKSPLLLSYKRTTNNSSRKFNTTL